MLVGLWGDLKVAFLLMRVVASLVPESFAAFTFRVVHSQCCSHLLNGRLPVDTLDVSLFAKVKQLFLLIFAASPEYNLKLTQMKPLP